MAENTEELDEVTLARLNRYWGDVPAPTGPTEVRLVDELARLYADDAERQRLGLALDDFENEFMDEDEDNDEEWDA